MGEKEMRTYKNTISTAMTKMYGDITREEVEQTLLHDTLATVAVRTTDANGYNEIYNSVCVSDLLYADIEENELLPDYNFTGCRAMDETDDIGIWCQEMSESLIDEYRKLMDEGRLYVAQFWSYDDGETDILIRKE